jgi:WD40 repeat protein
MACLLTSGLDERAGQDVRSASGLAAPQNIGATQAPLTCTANTTNRSNRACPSKDGRCAPASPLESGMLSITRCLAAGVFAASLLSGPAEAIGVLSAGTLPNGPATGVTVRGDGGQVAVTAADRLGLFTPQGQRQALLSPTGRLLVDAAYSGDAVFTLDGTGTLAQVTGTQVKVVGKALCGKLSSEQAPHLAVSEQTLAVSCPTALLVGRPGHWQKVALPASPPSFRMASRVALSPNGSEIAVIRDSSVLRYRLPELTPLATIKRLPGEDSTFMDESLTAAPASALAYDAAGRRLAVGWNMSFPKAYNQSVTVYDLNSGTGRSLPTYPDWTDHLAFNPDGSFLLADGSSTPRLWNLNTWKRLPSSQPTNTSIGVQSAAWLGKNLISVSRLGALALTPSGKQVARFAMPLSHLSRAAFSDNGQALALAGEGGQVYLYSLPENRLRWTVQAHEYGVSSLKFNRAGTLLVSGEFLRFWDVKTGRAVGPTVMGASHIAGFTPGDTEIVLGGRIVPVAPLLRRQGQVVLEDLPGKTYRKSQSNDSQLTPDGQNVCETSFYFRDKGLGFRASSWRLGGLEQKNFGLTLPEERRVGATSANCRVLAVAAYDVLGKAHTLKPLGVEVYDPATGKKVRTWGTQGRVKSLAVSPDGQQVAYLEEGRPALVLGNVQTGKQTFWMLPPVAQDIPDLPLVFRPDGRALLVGIGSTPETSFTVLKLP